MVLLHGEELGFIGQWSAANRINQVIGIFQFLLRLCSQLCQLKCSYHYDLYDLGIFYACVCVCTRVCVRVCVRHQLWKHETFLWPYHGMQIVWDLIVVFLAVP